MNLRLLLLIDDQSLQDRVQRLLDSSDVSLACGSPDASIVDPIEQQSPNLAIISHSLLGDSPQESVSALTRMTERPEVVVFWQEELPEERVQLISAGCLAVLNDQVADETMREALLSLIARCRQSADDRVSRKVATPHVYLDDFKSANLKMAAFLRMVRRVVEPHSSLLILGETGVGKERLARAIHAESPRADQPFIPVILSAFPETLLEGELFGYKKGAFTGAVESRRGLFELAHGGTVFLDEIGELPRHLQVKLLRLLQERKTKQLGSEEEIDVDVRVMAATNRDLREEVRKGEFRDDLFYRLSVVTLNVPPLRERPEDIPPLLERYLAELRTHFRRQVDGCSDEAMDWLCRYKWPGNVRELINVVERAVLLCETPWITLTDLPPDVYTQPGDIDVSVDGLVIEVSDEWLEKPWKLLRSAVLAECERRYLHEVLRASHANLTEAAQRADVNPRTLYDIMQRHGLRKEDFRYGSD